MIHSQTSQKPARNILSGIKIFILDALFPISCLGCGKSDVWLCSDCLELIPLKKEQVCPACEKNITPDGRVCFGCRRKSPLNGLLIATFYKDRLVSQAVHYFKYRFVENLGEPLGEILIKTYLNSQLPIPDLIIPVPLHKRRLRWRGFNQSELLANYLSKNLTPGLEIPVLNNLLIRKKYTRPQMEIKNYFQRRKNIQYAFEINGSDINCLPETPQWASGQTGGRNLYQTAGKSLKDKTILLVDDICTTGATLFECARVLKEAGAKEVFGVVVARQEYRK